MICQLVDFPGWESFVQISYSICHGLLRDNVCRARKSGYEDGWEETMLLQGEIGNSVMFPLRARTRFWRVTCFNNRLLCWTLHGADCVVFGSFKILLGKFEFKCKVDSVELRHKMDVLSSYSGYLSLKTSILTNFHQTLKLRKACVV